MMHSLKCLGRLRRCVFSCMKRYLRFLLSLLLSAGLMIASVPLVAFADVNDFAVSSDSNAGIMTLDLSDDDYGVSLMSSVGTVTNTVQSALVCIRYTNGTYKNSYFITPDFVDNRWDFGFEMPDSMNGYWINEVNFYLQSKTHNFNSLPSPPGDYLFSMDFSSDFSYGLSGAEPNIFSVYNPLNADFEYSYAYVTPSFQSGDFYISPTALDIGSSYNNVRLRLYIDQTDNLQHFAGSYSIAFKMTDQSGTGLVGSDLSYSDIVQNQVSGQLSGISSSVDEMTGEISEVADAIDALRGAMEPHYDNVLTQLHHITEQLHAFWNQLYNMFYLPQYARLGEILDAIRDMETGLGGVVSDASDAIINKLQGVQDAIKTTIDESTDLIIHGFDNSEMQENNDAFSSVLEQENAIQQDILSSIGALNNLITEDTQPLFDFSVLPFGVGFALTIVGSLMNLLFLAMGPFGQIALCGLTLSAFLIFIGFYRVRG